MVAIYLLLISCAALVSTEHTGAYSSPQYAKKMYPKKGYDTNALLPREKPSTPFKEVQDQDSIARFDNGNDTSQYGRSSFLDAAGSFLSGTGGQVMSSIAQDFIARSTGSSQVGFDCVSQVLSLNLTNLVILIVLKALILAAGFFGAGAWKGGHYYGRSLDGSHETSAVASHAPATYFNPIQTDGFVVSGGNPIAKGLSGHLNDHHGVNCVEFQYNKNATYLTEDEIMLYLSYLSGQQKKDYSCLYLLSCQRPQQAGLYSSGAELLLQGARLLQGDSPDLESYASISKNIKQAAEWGEAGMNCDTRYKCEA